MLDDHSRFSLALRACPDQQTRTVREQLTRTFRRYGLPERVLTDNGPPWGAPYTAGREDPPHYTQLTVWLMRLGVTISHSRPFHPQTLGKDERFHRTIQAEVLRYSRFESLQASQDRLTRWRDTYNLERPHEALDMDVQADHYQPSSRPFPEDLPAVEYGPDDVVKKVWSTGRISFQDRQWRVGAAFHGLTVALRPTSEDGRWNVFFCDQKIREIDLREPEL